MTTLVLATPPPRRRKGVSWLGKWPRLRRGCVMADRCPLLVSSCLLYWAFYAIILGFLVWYIYGSGGWGFKSLRAHQ
jgi:hypothetical protein